jgi:hypothetical protein
MSVAALAQAVRNNLVTPAAVAVETNLLMPGWKGWQPSICDLALPGGKPPAVAGDVFVGVHAFGWDTEDVEGLFEHMGVKVTISMKMRRSPDDRWAQAAIYNLPDVGGNAASPRRSFPGIAQPGIIPMAEAIRVQLHLDVNADAILNAANLLIDPYYGTGSQTLNGFVEPLVFAGGDSEPVERGASWWGAKAQDSHQGMSMTLTFMKAGRVQRIEQME